MIRGSYTTNPASLENSYAHVNVKGNSSIGSLIGTVNDKTSINNSYSTGSVIHSTQVVERLDILVQHCFICLL